MRIFLINDKNKFILPSIVFKLSVLMAMFSVSS